MKISGKVIQPRNIKEHTNITFYATYRGKTICVSSDHGFGKPINRHLTRYNMDVKDIATGMYDVQAYEDHYCMMDAIESALKGALLL